MTTSPSEVETPALDSTPTNPDFLIGEEVTAEHDLDIEKFTDAEEQD